MPTRQRYVVVGILALAVSVSAALSRGLEWTWVQLSWDDMPVLGLRQLPLTTVIAYVASFGTAAYCLKNPAISQLANEVVDELARVTWPSREETGSATVVVIVTVLICSAYLGVFDAFWLWLTDLILGAQGPAAG
jgi:preprotein translocase subunit SecE